MLHVYSTVVRGYFFFCFLFFATCFGEMKMIMTMGYHDSENTLYRSVIGQSSLNKLLFVSFVCTRTSVVD